jgi:DNA-binding response OmpR family regulator
MPTKIAILKICLVSDDRLVENAVRLAAPGSDILVYSIRGAMNQANELSKAGGRLVEAAQTANAVLMEWDFNSAPELNTLCFHIRRSARVPVYMLASGSGTDQVGSIAAGADDVLGFPLNVGLLQAKILSYHRLVTAAQDVVLEGRKSESPIKEIGQFGALKLDRTAHRFFIDEEEVELTPREFALLDYLIAHQDKLCTRDDILDHVWGISFDTGTNMVDVYMHFLRKKLEARGLAKMIETIRGRGYRLVLPLAV